MKKQMTKKKTKNNTYTFKAVSSTAKRVNKLIPFKVKSLKQQTKEKSK